MGLVWLVRSVIFAWFVVALAACDVSAPTPVAQAPAAPIIGGTPLQDDLAVVALVGSNTPSRDYIACTGTLVSRHVVATAAHCLDFEGAPAPDFVYFGADPAAGGSFRRVKKWFTHPEYLSKYTDDFRIARDVGVVVLDEAAPPEAIPYPLAQQPPVYGQKTRFAGFGCRDASGSCGPFGEKYEVSTQITAVTDYEFDYGVATCNGDSGGPAFVIESGAEVLLGVTSTGDTQCASFGVDARVDVLAPWLRRMIAAEDPETCTGADCPCAADGRCSVECSRPGNDPDCPVYCAPDRTCEIDCPERDVDCPARLPAGSACLFDTDCTSLACEEQVCRAACRPDVEATCASGLTCEEVHFGAHACLSESGGCGCRVGGRGRAGAAAGLLVALLLGWSVTRRRSPARARVC